MRTGIWPAVTLILMVAWAIGCGRPTVTSAPVVPTKSNDQDHSAWWCQEHGVPEEVCALCNSKVAAEFQKKGDWCSKHDRPDSQCFECQPARSAKFAAQYEAKYGRPPPSSESRQNSLPN